MNIWQDALTIEHTENSISQTYNIDARDVGILDAQNEDILVRMFALSQIPRYYNNMPMRRFNMHQTARGLWTVTVRWELINWSLQFELTGGTSHVTQSKETIAAYPGDGYTSAPNFNGAINVDRSTVHGCDIHTPGGQWSETYEVPIAKLTMAYEVIVKNLKKTPVNGYPFRGRAAGEVLFLGMSGAISSVDPRFYTLTWRFAEEANITGLTVQGITQPINKEGWQYVWYLYRQQVDSTSITTVQYPIAAYVERVYDYGDFSILNIGTTRTDAYWH
jgi:hypothetical protein